MHFNYIVFFIYSMRLIYFLPVSPRCGRSLPEFCPDQTLYCWPTARHLGPAAVSIGPSPCAVTWTYKSTQINLLTNTSSQTILLSYLSQHLSTEKSWNYWPITRLVTFKVNSKSFFKQLLQKTRAFIFSNIKIWCLLLSPFSMTVIFVGFQLVGRQNMSPWP